MKHDTDKKIPGYIKYFYILSSITLTCFILIVTRFIVNPLITATIVTILLEPLCNKLEKFGIPKVISTSISVSIFLISVFIFIALITTQFSIIASDPAFSFDSISKIINNIQSSLSMYFGIYIEKFRFNTAFFNNSFKGLAPYFPGVLAGTANYLAMIVLFTISLFFFIYYRIFFVSFIYKCFNKSNHDNLESTMEKINIAIKNYISGLLVVILIVSFLNSIGLLFLGINHAIFFGVISAILTIVPYIGILICSIITAFYALITYDSLWYPLGVILIFGFVQFLEGNFITPIIIGSKENVNPYIAILGLFVGGMLLGAVGIVLAIPLLGIIKIICDVFPHLNTISYVMGFPRKERMLLQKFSKAFNDIFKRGE